jgi:nucleoside phosphorylase
MIKLFLGISLWAVVFMATTPLTVKADTVAFFYALDKDLETLKAEAQPARQPLKVGSRSLQPLSLGAHRIYAVKMGSGVVETATSAQALLARVKCDAVFSVGPVGGIADTLPVGSWHEVAAVTAYQKGSWTQTGFQISDHAEWALTNSLTTNLPVLFQNLGRIKIASGEIFVASDSFRTQLRQTSGAAAVDMNLFGLLTVCADHQLPVHCWRVVSDHADNRASEDFKKFVADYDGAGGKAIAQIIKNLPANPNAPASYPNLKKHLSGS